MYMCVKFPPGDLNLSPYPPHPTSIYTCGVTTAPRVCGGRTTIKLPNCAQPLIYIHTHNHFYIYTHNHLIITLKI